MKPRYAIGIDPGVYTGVALVDREERKPVALLTTDAFDACQMIREGYRVGDVVIILEDPDQHSKVWFDDKSARSRKSVGTLLKVAQSVGENKAAAKLIKRKLEEWGYDVQAVPPVAKRWSGPNRKITAQEFEALTGYAGRSSQHARDAGVLAWRFGL